MTPTLITLLRRGGMNLEEAQTLATEIHNKWPGRFDLCMVLAELFRSRKIRVVLEGE